jgi:hypothetical protein
MVFDLFLREEDKAIEVVRIRDYLTSRRPFIDGLRCVIRARPMNIYSVITIEGDSGVEVEDVVAVRVSPYLDRPVPLT